MKKCFGSASGSQCCSFDPRVRFIFERRLLYRVPLKLVTCANIPNPWVYLIHLQELISFTKLKVKILVLLIFSVIYWFIIVCWKIKFKIYWFCLDRNNRWKWEGIGISKKFYRSKYQAIVWNGSEWILRLSVTILL